MLTFKSLQNEILNRGRANSACKPGLDMVIACQDKTDLLKAITRFWIWCYEQGEIIDDQFILNNFTGRQIKDSNIYLMADKLEYADRVKTLALPSEGWDAIFFGDKPVRFARTNAEDDKLAFINPYGGHHLFTHENAFKVVDKLESRMPSELEWTLFCDNMSVWDDDKRGRWFKCRAPKGFVDVFLPASGYRVQTSGAFNGTGAYGYYWSCAPNGAYTYYLYFYTTYVYPTGNLYRAFGFPVRCVQDLP